jgi:ubiquitin-protein ligase
MTDRALRRISIDIADLQKDPIAGTAIYVDETDIKRIYVAIVGPDDSCYESGVYFFQFDFPNTYPHEPPKGKFLNYQNSTVRMHPNMYVCGKLCLSILGTWNGPSWTSVMTLKSIILNIQALLDDDPLRNEPGYENGKLTEKHKNYAKIIRYYNYKDFVCGTNKILAQATRPVINYFSEFLTNHFKTNRDKIITKLSNLNKDGVQKIRVDYHSTEADINYEPILDEISKI